MKNETSVSEKEGIVIIGAGRFAGSLARSMPERIVAIISRTGSGDLATRIDLGDVRRKDTLSAVDPNSYGIIWIATIDASIPEVAASIAAMRPSWKGVTVVHSSGATPVDALEPVRALGGRTIALHPNGSFTGDEPIPPGLVWGISPPDSDSMRVAEELLAGLEPVIVPIDDDRRGLYHAAASMAANFSVTLFAAAVDLYRRAGMSEDDARDVVRRFMEGSARNSAMMGPRAALTGPIVRGDMSVVAAQIDAIGRYAPEYLPLTKELVMRTASLADRDDVRGWLGMIERVIASRSDGDQEERGTPAAQSGQESAS